MASKLLKSLVGAWKGTCRTWFEADQLADESSVTGTIRPILDGRLFRHEYQATLQGRPRNGEETLAFQAVTKKFQSSWVDDFHMNEVLLFSEGQATRSGFEVTGHYDVGANEPPWRWKTVYEMGGPDELTITAYNISPDGQEAKAVETKYRRRAP